MQLDLSILLKLFLLMYIKKRKISHIWVAYIYDRGTVICLNLLNLYFPKCHLSLHPENIRKPYGFSDVFRD